MTWPFENDTHKVEKKLATQSLSANKQRNFLAGIIMFIASLLLAFSTILLCNATIDTQIISRVDNTQEILSVILGIAIVLADEPTGNLDSKTSAEVLGLIKRTSAEFRQTVVMITHNDDIARLADRIVRIEDGKIVE